MGEFVSLKIVNVVSKDEATPTPFVIRRLIGRVYHVGPEGITVGTSSSSSSSSSISLPAESLLETKHFQIKPVTAESASPQSDGHFVLKDLTNNSKISIDHMTSHVAIEEGVLLSSGARFTIGAIVWELSALPKELELTAKLFYLAESRNLEELEKTIESIEPATSNIPTLTVTGIIIILIHTNY